jgi:hypothetical protein
MSEPAEASTYKPQIETPPPSHDARYQNAVATYTETADAIVQEWHVETWPLDRVKTIYRNRVEEDAERVRLRYITPGAGMAMTYAEKHQQAQAVEAMGEAPANALTPEQRTAQFPTLAASVGIEAPTLWGCALLVIQKYEQFAQLSGAIERTRLLAKKAISDASDPAAVVAAYGAITWPNP